jgi:HIV Tat-specific factor 1
MRCVELGVALQQSVSASLLVEVTSIADSRPMLQNVQKPKKSRVNTAVYVTSIPLDATANEIRDVFCKCGVIAEEIDSGRPRIKMYTDANGTFKGEALIVYFRPESVNLAIQMLDESDFRLGVRGPFGSMRVQSADYSFKSQQEAPAKTNLRDKKKILKKTQKLNRYTIFYLFLLLPLLIAILTPGTY